MVVTRRQQGAPTPASRTNSAQPIPRVKGKVPAVPDVPSPLANGGSGPHPEDGSGTKDLTVSDVVVTNSLYLMLSIVRVRVEEGQGERQGKEGQRRTSDNSNTAPKLIMRLEIKEGH